MQMAKKVCEDWTTLIWNEAVLENIMVNDADINEKVHEVLRDNNFVVEYTNLLEKTFALGTGVMVEFVSNNKIMIDYIIGDLVLVTSYRNQEVNGICTVNTILDNDEVLTHLTYHDLRDITVDGENKSVYTIEHEVFVSKKRTELGKAAPLIRIFTQEEIVEMGSVDGVQLVTNEDGLVFKAIITFETDTAHFQMIKPNLVNNFDLENPMGISVFANRIDDMMTIDLYNDAFSSEPALARHRILVDNSVTKETLKTVVSGNNALTVPFSAFDIDDEVFLGGNLKNSDDPIRFFSAEIRAEAYVKGLNFKLQSFGFGCGLGTDYYAFDARGVYQNEKAVVSENSDLWATKKKHEVTTLTAPITKLVKAILFLLRELGEIEGDIDQLEITVKPDDSIIIDDEAQYQKDLDLVDRGMMSKWQVLVKWFGLTEQEARAQVLESEGITEQEDNPLVTPDIGEDEETFIARFMSNEEMILEFPEEAQRLQVAQEQFANSGS
jgi:A118 family predicted phage portal protein